MESAQVEKNKLDLLYRRSLQEHNAILILGTTGVLAFIGTFVWSPANLKGGASLTAIIWIFCSLWYLKVNKQLGVILEELNKLKR